MALEKIPSFQEVKDWAASKTALNDHIDDENNPHNVNSDDIDVDGFSGSHNDLHDVSDDDHHERYTDSEAEDAAPVQSVNGQTDDVDVDEFSGSHNDLHHVGSSDHHSRYTDSEASSAAPVSSVNGQTGSVSISPSADLNASLNQPFRDGYTWYQNTTGNPIWLSVVNDGSGHSNRVRIHVNDRESSQLVSISTVNDDYDISADAIIPDGYYYRVASGTDSWTEVELEVS